jgi:BlaR1 peptidase M56
MIAEVFVYVIAVTLLIGLAALSVEQFLAEIRRPRRYAWLAAYAAALLFPPLSLLLAGSTPAAEEIVAASLYAASPPSRFDWDALLIQAWAVATCVLMIAYLAAWIRLAMLAKHWPRAASDHPLVVLADDVGPAVLGIFRPRIVMPRWLMDSPASVRSTIVAHELAHIAARDQALIVAAQLVTVLLPWNLPLWLFVTRLRAAIEVDCDARVLRDGVDAGHYADVLLQVGQRRSFSPYAAATLIEPVTQLERRIRIMLTRRKPGAALRAAAAATAALALAACMTRVEPPAVLPGAEPAVEVGLEVPIPIQEQVQLFNSLTPAQQQAMIREMQRSLPPAQRWAVIRMLQGGAEPAAAAGAESSSQIVPRITARVPGPVRLVQNADGGFTMHASEIVVSGVDGTARVTSNQIIGTPSNVVLEGGVVLDYDDRTSITAARAVATHAPDGSTTITLEDATVTLLPEATGL